ncbi:MAG: hypothetical protein CSA44_00180 [Gammaproteobacteria bacterium]|nr:MAG: hypothetical protein CSA44_00180 [Gammaproteobacteria bacterium]
MKKPKASINNEPQVAQVDLGGLLHEERQKKQLSIATVAGQVNLSTDIIEQLESNRFSEIGPSVYVRGYLGLYARYLGIDTTYFINLYDAQYPSSDIGIAGLVYGYSRVEPLIFNQGQSKTPAATDKNPVNAAIDATETANNLANDVLNDLPITPPKNQNDALTLPDIGTIQLESSDNGIINEIGTIQLESSDETITNNAITAAEKTAEQPDQPTTEPGKPVTLKMRFSDECWIKATDANGKVLVSKIYKKGQKLSRKGVLPITIAVARVNAIQSLTLDDKPLKLSDYKIGNIKYELK